MQPRLSEPFLAEVFYIYRLPIVECKAVGSDKWLWNSISIWLLNSFVISHWEKNRSMFICHTTALRSFCDTFESVVAAQDLFFPKSTVTENFLGKILFQNRYFAELERQCLS